MEYLIAVLLILAALFFLLSGVAIVRFKDAYSRLHAPTPASTLGMGALLLAAMLWQGSEDILSVKAFLIMAVLFVTSPISAYMLAKTALHLRLPLSGGRELPEIYEDARQRRSLMEKHSPRQPGNRQAAQNQSD